MPPSLVLAVKDDGDGARRTKMAVNFVLDGRWPGRPTLLVSSGVSGQAEVGRTARQGALGIRRLVRIDEVKGLGKRGRIVPARHLPAA
jgi:hypothetical protein